MKKMLIPTILSSALLTIIIYGATSFSFKLDAKKINANAMVQDRVSFTLSSLFIFSILPYGVLALIGYSLEHDDSKYSKLQFEEQKLSNERSNLLKLGSDLEAKKKELDFRFKTIEKETTEFKNKVLSFEIEYSTKLDALNKYEQSLRANFEDTLASEVDKKLEEYIRLEACKLALEIESRVSMLIDEEQSIINRLEELKESLYLEALDKAKQELKDEFKKLEHSKEKSRLEIERAKLNAKQTIESESKKLSMQVSTIAHEKGILDTWLNRIAQLSKPKESKEISAMALYDKFKSLLFSPLNSEIKPCHLRIIAGTEGGKSTLIQNLLTLLIAEIPKLKTIIADGAGNFSQSDWGKLNREYSGYEECLDGLAKIDKEFEARSTSNIDKSPILFVLDEADETLKGQSEHQKILSKLLRKGRHQNIFLILICQSKNIKHLGLDDSDRTNYSTLVMGNALVNFLNGDSSVLTSKQREQLLRYFESLIDKEPESAIFYALVVSKHKPKPEILQTPKPKEFEQLITVHPTEQPENDSEQSKNNSEQPKNSLVNESEQQNIRTLLEEFNGSVREFESFGKLAKNVIGHPNRSAKYKAKRDYLISLLKEQGINELLPK